MSNLGDLEARITHAMERISRGVEVMAERADAAAEAPAPQPAPAADAEELARLKSELEDERIANAQLQERVRAIKRRQDETVEELEKRTASQGERIAALDGALGQLRKAAEALRANNEALRAAVAAGTPDADALQAGLVAELEALKAERAAEKAEAEAILGALRPIVEGKAG